MMQRRLSWRLVLLLLLLHQAAPLRLSVYTPSAYAQNLPSATDVPCVFFAQHSLCLYTKHHGVNAEQLTQAVECFQQRIERRVLPVTGSTYADCLAKAIRALEPAADEAIEVIIHNPSVDFANYTYKNPDPASTLPHKVTFSSSFFNTADPPSARYSSFITPTPQSLAIEISNLLDARQMTDSGLCDTHFFNKERLCYDSIVASLKSSKVVYPRTPLDRPDPPTTLESKAFRRTLKKPDLYINTESEDETRESLLRFLALPLAVGVISPEQVMDLNPLLTKDMEDRIKLQDRARSESESGDGKWFLWNGFFAKYYETPPSSALSPPSTSPDVVLCHGFGGSGRQLSSLAKELSKFGHRSYAPDLLGFGRSQKPRVLYTQYLWSMYLSDFTRRFVESSDVVLGGNSIGGYTVMASASEINNVGLSTTQPTTPTVKGIALFNSAGVLYEPDEYKSKISTEGTIRDQTLNDRLPPFAPPPSFLLNLGSTLILKGLRPRIRSTLEWLYPERTSRVTDELAADILTDSYDFGAKNVIISGGKLPSPQSANELLDPAREGFGGPVIVCQGTEDPLNDAKLRADQFERVRDDIEIKRIAAGHCVMDEKPAEVASYLVDWMKTKC
ncbi:hypothetical protein TrVE_jg12100 [Triparma verrucosa]|uniref:AB hydrolase-1 domain-containing protein n=1 Tax=Triparma verrucosa TaxID=1606542 RepID=A0A9W7CBD2_9STRA|nr:hypothetical protein TrVE_jg12100 [Triparma verrucosa]